MRVVEYEGFHAGRHAAAYARVCQALAVGDFRAAQVKKLAALGAAKLYRARLSDADRLLFALYRHAGEMVVLVLELIVNHDYAASRFLRGVVIDEARLVDEDAVAAAAEAAPLRYLHPERRVLQLLDKPLSLDDVQEAVYRLPAPLVLVGSAGSGKTALTLAKLRHARGDVLYVTHSAYLALASRELYHAHGWQHDEQAAQFLSYRAFLESIRLPPGREVQWRDFAAWFARTRQLFKSLDAHQAFEEIRGVITAPADVPLSREAYVGLGVRQSIVAASEREAMYGLYERYRAWLDAAGLYDINLAAQAARDVVQPHFDFVVVDEVQDLTIAQLALVLRSLRERGQFLLCGDSNQIVHPNFFAWHQVKSLFWREPELAERQALQVLAANYRNSPQATDLANRLLKIKHRRFGSVDRESNFLVRSVGGEPGEVRLLADREAVVRELDQASRRSTRFAVLVAREEDKPRARERFATPLVFSVHEAKGLEYDNIVLDSFVSGARAAYADIAAGVSSADLDDSAELAYSRAKDKGDKSLEIFKFHVNALYVALTRSRKNVYLVESDLGHPLLALLGLREAQAPQVRVETASPEEWQREAAKLSLQGKQEQADAIRRGILHQAPVPWTVFDERRLRETLAKVFVEQVPGAKPRQQLLEYAAVHQEPGLAEWLAEEAGQATTARQFDAQQLALARKYLQPYQQRQFKDVLRQCAQHGVDHRTPMNLTPLMAAVQAGNVALVEALLDIGAGLDAVDAHGRTALHWALAIASREPAYARGPFIALHARIAPAWTDLRAGDRLLRIDAQQSEFLVLHTQWALFKTRLRPRSGKLPGSFDTGSLIEAWQALPAQVLPERRRKRAHLSNVLSRNEVMREHPYNRALFLRAQHGQYWLNPALAVRRGGAGQGEGPEVWQPLYELLNLRLARELAPLACGFGIGQIAQAAGMGELPEPMAARRRLAQRGAE